MFGRLGICGSCVWSKAEEKKDGCDYGKDDYSGDYQRKMASFPGKIFTRQQMMDDIWGYGSESDTHTVDVHIGRLRERFRDNEDFKIVTMRGVGYKVIKA